MDPPGRQQAPPQPEMDQPGHQPEAHVQNQQPWEYRLRNYLLLLATVVVTVTYAAGFNPPGGNWQEGAYGGRLAGDPILRDIHYHRYLAFFYCNATAFAASLVVIVLILILAVRHDKEKDITWVASEVKPLRVVMVLDLLSLVGAYSAGTCRDKISTVYSAVLVAIVFIYVLVLKFRDWWSRHKNSGSGSGAMTVKEKKMMKEEERLRKVLMLLATFAVSITYVAGLSTPGGFRDSPEGSHRPGDTILKEHHSVRLTVFLLCNTTAFVASLLITMLLIIAGKKLHDKPARSRLLYTCIVVALVGLIGAYAAGSCRETDTTVYVVSLVGAVVAYILLHGFCSSDSKLFTCCCRPAKQSDDSSALGKARSLVLLLATLAATITYTAGLDPPGGVWQDNDNGPWHMAGDPILLTTNARRYKAFYYCNSVAFVASLVAIVLVQKEILVKHHVLEAAMILDLFGLIGAYAAGSCRDVSTSIYAMALAGAVLVYVVIHVVFFTLDHQKDKQEDDEDRLLEKRRKRLLLFAILAATITYQAGLTPPGGFLLQDNEFGHHAGDPVLLYNYPRRYNAFFYCNSVSFMLSIALIILLVNPNLYRPAIRSNALSVCTAVGLFCLMGAYAAGSTQHLKTSIYIFVLMAMVLFVVAGLLIVFFLRAVALSRPIEREGKEKENKNGNSAAAESCTAIEQEGKEEENKNGNSAAAESCIPIEQEGKEEENKNGNSAAVESCIPIEQEDKEPIEHEDKEKRKEEGKKHARRKYLMLLGILVASVAYQAGLEPPGGAWQSSREGHEAGHPVMHDNRRPQYLAFFYSNSISFMASIVVIIMLLPHWLPNKEKESFSEEKKKELEEKKKKWEEWSLKVMNKTILLDLAALLGAYAAGSSRGWKTSVYVIALIVAVLGYFAIHMKLSKCSERHHKAAKGAQSA